MKVKSKSDAWKMANELFPTGYKKDEERSKQAGYPQYYSTSKERSNDHINDLNIRLELVIGDECINIWVDENMEDCCDKCWKEQEKNGTAILCRMCNQRKVRMSKRLYEDIKMLLSERRDCAQNGIEFALSVLDDIDHSDPDNFTQLRNAVEHIKDR